MKSALFVRPNLKLFLLGALLVALANDLLVGGQSRASARTIPIVGKCGFVTEEEFLRLRQHAVAYPSAEAFIHLSQCYQEKGLLREAMACLQWAQQLEDQEMLP